MTNTTTERLFNDEMNNSLEIINMDIMAAFLYMYADEEVGHDKNGKPTTLVKEIGEVARMTHMAYVDDGINYYNTRHSMRMVEKTRKKFYVILRICIFALLKSFYFLTLLQKNQH